SLYRDDFYFNSPRDHRDLPSFPTRRSSDLISIVMHYGDGPGAIVSLANSAAYNAVTLLWIVYFRQQSQSIPEIDVAPELNALNVDRKSTRLNSSHVAISYAVFCLKKKKVRK